MLTYRKYLEIVTPDGGEFSEHRKSMGIVNNVVKWLAMRFSYILYRLGFTANFLDVFGIIICFIGYYSFITGLKSEFLLYTIVGTLLIYFHTWIDFLDGALAKAQNKISVIGGPLDDIGCDLSRFAMFITFGLIINDFSIILLNVFSAVILIHLFTNTVRLIPDIKYLRSIIKVYNYKWSFLSVRFMLGILPLFFTGSIYLDADIKFICTILSVFYGFAAMLWLMICIPTYEA